MQAVFYWLEHFPSTFKVTECIEINSQQEPIERPSTLQPFPHQQLTHQSLSITRTPYTQTAQFDETFINTYLGNFQAYIIRQPSSQIGTHTVSLTYPLTLNQMISHYGGQRANQAHAGILELTSVSQGELMLRAKNSLDPKTHENKIHSQSPIHLLLSLWHEALNQPHMTTGLIATMQISSDILDVLTGISPQYGIAFLTQQTGSFVGVAYFLNPQNPDILLLSEKCF